ncbi:MAG: DUF4345 domain-containing protein [Methyloceanibacter sp.]|uniref:DUF4345 domain-containing protein n=1 Tax=Methyloceanibacter sp. TaxID=1965321 RepID=UPI003D6D2B13
MPQSSPDHPRNSKLMRLYLLFAAVLLVPIALAYGIAPAATVPRLFDIAVTTADQKQIFRALMCLYLGLSAYWVYAAFTAAWQRPAVALAVIFCFSLALGRGISLVADGPASRLLDIYLVVEILGGLLGIAVLAYERRKSRR